MSLSFAVMTPEQEATYLPVVVVDYAAELVRSGYDEAQARSRSEASFASLHEDGETYLAAYDDDGAWVGVLAYVLKGFDDGPTAARALFVYDLEVFEEFRRRGHATALLDHAAALAEEAGADEVLLTVLEGNDAGRRLYERRGFTYQSHRMRLPVRGWTERR